MYEGSCHYSIKMYVPSQDNVRVMYMCMRVPATNILIYMCPSKDNVRVMYVCMRVPATILLRYICPPPGQCPGHLYVHDGFCHYSIKMYMPSRDSVWLIYIYVNEGLCHYSIKMYVPS